jgi:hypothetical protein
MPTHSTTTSGFRHKPTPDEKRIIRDCAKRSAGCGRVRIEPGYRYNMNDPTRNEGPDDLNIALLSDQPDWEDTDLADTTDWETFCKHGFQWAEGQRAIVDFYVYSTGDRGELETNVTAYWENGLMVRVDGTGNGTMWTVPGYSGHREKPASWMRGG